MAATARILDFLRTEKPEGPCLVLDLEVVRENYLAFARTMPGTRIFYAVKANPAPEILSLLASHRLVLRHGLGGRNRNGARCRRDAGPHLLRQHDQEGTRRRPRACAGRRSSRSIATRKSRRSPVPLPAPACSAACSPMAKVPNGRCRASSAACRRWLSTCSSTPTARPRAYGVSFHVGSQMTKVDAWDSALADAKRVFVSLAKQGIELKMVNMGGGFPTKYLKDIPSSEAYGQRDLRLAQEALRQPHSGNHHRAGPRHGRQCRRDQGGSRADLEEVGQRQPSRWVFLDIGKFGGLAETMDEAIRYPIRTAKRRRRDGARVLAGPTCDSADVLYEKNMYPLPITLTIGDEVLIEGTGAYTTTYSAVAFNGFEPLKAYVI
jgi:ornithine decarboxylase